MSIISVDTELLQLKSANVQATVDRISADVQAMKRGLDELQGIVAGHPPPPISRRSSRNGPSRRDRVEASLASINMALASAAATYAQAEQGNTQRFS